LFNNNEQPIIMNMNPDLNRYQHRLQAWMPGLRIVPPNRGFPTVDAIIEWKGPQGPVRYIAEWKAHFAFQDAAVVAEQLKHWQVAFAQQARPTRMVLLAPYVRPQQGALLKRAGIDYVDLIGNAHLQVPGLFVHVEGQRPEKTDTAGPTRPNRAWIKAVLAMLLRPELVQAPYRMLAGEAGVALGTVAACVRDLERRGLLEERLLGRRIVNQPQLVALWVQAYVDVLRPKLREVRFQTRITDKRELWALLDQTFKRRGVRWTLTGADAAELRNRFFRAPETEIYVPWGTFDDWDLQKELMTQPAPRVGNLVAVEPPGPAIPEKTVEGIPIAPALLIYAELRYRGTEQAVEGAEMLLPDVMSGAGI
jgi:hypothetical protein